MSTFILIRHAEAPWSEDEGRPLSAAGACAAESLCERLSGLPIRAIYSSPYRRSLETVLPLARALGLSASEIFDLRERTLGTFQGVAFEDAVAATWSDFDRAHPGGESSRAAQRRALAALRELARRHPSETVAVATHGNLLALLLNAFDPNVGFDFWRSLAFPDAYELRLLASGGGVFRRIEGPSDARFAAAASEGRPPVSAARGTPAVRVFAPGEWPTYRTLRLRALADSPDAFGSTLADEAGRPDEHWAARLANGVASALELPLVAELEGEPAGLVWARVDPAERAAHLYQMWVAPEHRARGAGERLLEAAVAWARASGARALLLCVTCGDTSATRLYARAGFEPDGAPQPLRPGSSVLAQPMRLRLG